MGLIYRFPTNVALDMVVQEYMPQAETLRAEEILPFQEVATQKVQWDEKDTMRGMTAPHVMGTDPKIDRREGSKTHEYEPIPFKEEDLIKEDELLKARQLGTLGGVVNLNQKVAEVTKDRMDKTKLRCEHTRWQTLRGKLEIAENGVRVKEIFPVQKFTPPIPWGDRKQAKILVDTAEMKRMYRGTGASIRGAVAIGNNTTISAILENANPDDLQGFRAENFRNANYDLNETNKLLAARGLFMLEENDEGWIDEDGEFQTWLDDGELIIVGKRPQGQKIGAWLQTPHLHRQRNGNPAPGFFSLLECNGVPSMGGMTVDLGALGAGKNPKIGITGGVYGGPVLWYPRSIIYAKVF